MRNRVTAVALAAALRVGLAPLSAPGAAGCVDGQDPALLRDIRRRPATYYANIHTLEFEPGAIRGQLHRLA